MKTIFLDRDGVINRYPGDTKYVTSWKEFKFLARVKKALAQLNKEKFRVIVISNQAGINKGIYTRKKLDLITRNMLREIRFSGGKIQAVYYCTHRKEENCSCRKPKAGLLHLAKDKYGIKLRNSFFIGDTMRDVRTAKNTGCKSILLLSGKEKVSNKRRWELQPDFVFRDLYEATRFLIKQKIKK